METKKTKKEKLSVTWFGHSAFLLKAPGGKSILVDPWLDNPNAPPEAKSIAPVDLILITHAHSDHLGSAVEVAKRTGAKVISIHEISLYLQDQGMGDSIGMNKGGTVSVDGIGVTMVDARHSSAIDGRGAVLPGGEAAGYVVTFENGFRVYDAGDTAVFGDMKIIADIYKPELAILPIGGLYTMGPVEAAYACRLLKPKYVIGMHYGTFPPLSGTPEQLRQKLPASMRKIVLELKPGNRLSIV